MEVKMKRDINGIPLEPITVTDTERKRFEELKSLHVYNDEYFDIRQRIMEVAQIERNHEDLLGIGDGGYDR
jgi:hypothetical protein